jgi:hypothetical protein
VGDEIGAQARKYGVPPPRRAPPDLDKDRAARRANLAGNIAAGLLCDTPIARNTDPDTSHAAAEFMRASGARATQQQRILDVVRRLPGLTVVELAVQVGLNDHKVGKRLSDLATAQKIGKGDERHVNGLPYSTWWPR